MRRTSVAPEMMVSFILSINSPIIISLQLMETWKIVSKLRRRVLRWRAEKKTRLMMSSSCVDIVVRVTVLGPWSSVVSVIRATTTPVLDSQRK